MPKLISNTTNIPLTQKELKSVIIKAIAISLPGLALTVKSFCDMKNAKSY